MKFVWDAFYNEEISRKTKKKCTFAAQLTTMLYEIVISNTIELLRLSALDIFAIQADGNYSKVILTDGTNQLISMQLGQVEELLKEQLGDGSMLFVRIGRPVIINLEYLYMINLTKQEMILRSGDGRQVAFNASRKALQQLKQFVEEKTAK